MHSVSITPLGTTKYQHCCRASARHYTPHARRHCSPLRCTAQQTSSTLPPTADVAVLGAGEWCGWCCVWCTRKHQQTTGHPSMCITGIIGLWTAHTLLQRDNTIRVALIDKGAGLCEGATGVHMMDVIAQMMWAPTCRHKYSPHRECAHTVFLVSPLVTMCTPHMQHTGAGQGYCWLSLRTVGTPTWDACVESKRMWEAFCERGVGSSVVQPTAGEACEWMVWGGCLLWWCLIVPHSCHHLHIAMHVHTIFYAHTTLYTHTTLDTHHTIILYVLYYMYYIICIILYVLYYMYYIICIILYVLYYMYYIPHHYIIYMLYLCTYICILHVTLLAGQW